MAELNLYHQLLEALWKLPVFELPQAEKETRLMPLFLELDKHHRLNSSEYQRLTSSLGELYSLSSLPYVAVRLFKHLNLRSIDQDKVFRVLQSSGTTAQTPARVFLDKETSARQSKTLVKILQQSIGNQRLPMLIIDSPDIVNGGAQFSARAAGIQGLAFFGRDHTYALDHDMQPNWPVIETFLEKYSQQPVLIFGFTFMVWLHFISVLEQQGKKIHLPHGVLLHSGGWKKLESKKVDNRAFKQKIQDVIGVSNVVNFYGMAEQVGSVFTECTNGHLHAPLFADVIVRDPYTLEPCPHGQTGLLQVLSILPTSYPGYSLLTEDLGLILGVDDCECGRKGKYFKVVGRLPKSEVRGCSDTHKGV